MWLIVIGSVIGLLVSIWLSENEPLGTKVSGAIMAAVLGAIFGIFVATIGSIFVPTHVVSKGVIEIVSIRSGEGVSGSFFLGTGTIDGYPHYTYFRQMSDGGLVQETIPASRTLVYEDMVEQKGRIEIYDTDPVPPWESWVATIDYGQDYRVHIPRGSILRNFELR